MSVPEPKAAFVRVPCQVAKVPGPDIRSTGPPEETTSFRIHSWSILRIHSWSICDPKMLCAASVSLFHNWRATCERWIKERIESG